MLQLFPLFSVLGISSSFWYSILPTAINFSTHNSQLIYLPAIYSLGIGIGEVFMALLIAQLSRRIKGFSLQPTMTIGAIFSVLALVLVQLSTPWDAPMRPTREEPIGFYHSYVIRIRVCRVLLNINCYSRYPFIFTLALLIGIGDCCLNSCRSVICALAMPDRRAQAFSISKLYQVGLTFLP
uniref:Uncharacterized protein n=1 Tax=Caenorhabditis japonica TaxID=281687 RepID=A0A8R1IN80_CAEJA